MDKLISRYKQTEILRDNDIKKERKKREKRDANKERVQNAKIYR